MEGSYDQTHLGTENSLHPAILPDYEAHDDTDHGRLGAEHEALQNRYKALQSTCQYQNEKLKEVSSLWDMGFLGELSSRERTKITELLKPYSEYQ